MTKDRIAGTVLLLFCLFFYYQTTLIDTKGLTDISAAFFPSLLLGLIAVLTVIMMIQSFFTKVRKTAEQKGKKEKEGIVWIIFALFALYILSLEILGFILSSFIFITVLYFIILPVKKSVKSHVIALSGILVVTIALAYIFQNFLNVFLPTGIFF